MVILTSDAFVSLEEGLYRKFSTGASVIILEMGFSYGSVLFESLNKAAMANKDLDPPNEKSLADLLMKTGCGKLSIEGDIERGSRLSFSVKNCAFCGKRIHELGCNFLRGIIVGLSAGLYAKQYKSTVECVQGKDGAHVCLIGLIGK